MTLLALEGVGKDYPRLDTRGGRLRLVADLLRGRAPEGAFCALDATRHPPSRTT